MRIKKYYAATVRQALDQAKAELGENISIVSTRTVPGRGWLSRSETQCELVVAVDDPALEGPAQVEPRLAEWQEIKSEIAELRSALDRLAGYVFESRAICKNGIELYRTLAENGIEHDLAYSLARELAERFKGEGRQKRSELSARLAELLKDLISISPLETGKENGPRIAVFIGPPGVGKTTNIAKLAAHHALQMREQVLLVTLDTYRIAAMDQLESYARIIGVPFEVAGSLAELLRNLAAKGGLAAKDLILVDTTGCSHKNRPRLEELAAGLRVGAGAVPPLSVEKHLVLNAAAKGRDLYEVIDSFALFHPNKLFFTRLDETSTFGNILSVAVRAGKPLSYLSCGQNVPDDISVPTAQGLAELLLQAGVPRVRCGEKKTNNSEANGTRRKSCAAEKVS